MIRFVKPPFDPPRPNDLAGQLAEAIRIAAADLASKKETELGHVVTGCDGYPVVTIGDGTSCHDNAKAANGGGLALTANLGGSRAVINANLGRSQSMNSGYQGTGLSSGAIPPALDAGAADVSLNPIDTSTVLAIGAGDSVADPLAAMIGATIEGRTGDSKRMLICYQPNGAGIWDDVLTGSETAVTGLSIDPNYVGALGGGKYALTKLTDPTVSHVDGTAESSTTSLPAWNLVNYAYSAVAVSRDLDTMAVWAHADGSGDWAIYIGTSMLTAPSWAALNVGALFHSQVYGLRCLAFDHNGNLWASGQLGGPSPYLSTVACIKIIAPPYSGVTYTLTPSWVDDAAMGDPTPLALSRDGRYMASAVHQGANIIDVWSVSARTIVRTLPRPTGYTNELIYGAMQWGPDGRLFGLLKRTADSVWCLAVWDAPASGSTPEIIPLTSITPPTAIIGWLSVSGDGQVCMVGINKDADPKSMCAVEPPYTAGGATVTGFYPAFATLYQFEFDPSESYALATGLTLVASVTSATGSGSSIAVVTRLTYANTSGVAAFGVVIEMALPDGSTFVSATDGGLYDSEAGIVKWLIPSVAASGTGYVECTTTTGA